MNIYFDEAEQVSKEIIDIMTKAAEICLVNEGIEDTDNCELSVSFVSADEIHELNREHRGVDRKTDVLSFPQFETVDELEDSIEMFGEVSIGDVVICRDVAAEQAEEFGHSFEREIIYLFVHSIHHLLGYDHMEEDEKKEMRAAEEAVMNELGILRD